MWLAKIHRGRSISGCLRRTRRGCCDCVLLGRKKLKRIRLTRYPWNVYLSSYLVADPGFPVGGAPSCGGEVLTSDVGTFWQKRIEKRKNWIPWGGGGGHAGGTPGSANAIE